MKFDVTKNFKVFTSQASFITKLRKISYIPLICGQEWSGSASSSSTPCSVTAKFPLFALGKGLNIFFFIISITLSILGMNN